MSVNSDDTILLNNGSKIPSIGMGCWMGSPGHGERVYNMCEKALKNGYRHFDTAAGYYNEKQVGDAIRNSKIPRSEIYLTTKLANGDHHRVREAFEDSLKQLDSTSVNDDASHGDTSAITVLGPDQEPTFIDTYKDMEKLLETGKVKSIGVSNFSIKTLTELLPHCSIIPVTNQVELHPCLPLEDLKAFCEEKWIVLTAYSPLGASTTLISEPTIKRIAERHKVSPAQVVLSWGAQRGTIIIPKSEDEGRMIANRTLIKLSEDDMQAIGQIHLQPGMHKSLLTQYHLPQGTILGWKYEWLGWNMTTGGIVPQDP